MTLYSVFRNYFNFQAIRWLGIYRSSFLRNIYIFTRFFYWTKYHWKFDQVAEAVSCKKFAMGLQLYWKDTGAQLFSCIISEVFQKNCFIEHAAPKTNISSYNYFMVVFFLLNSFNPTNIYLLKVNNRNSRRKCKIC